MTRTFRTAFVTVLLCVSVQWTCWSGEAVQGSPSTEVGGATPPSGSQCLPRIGSGCPEGWSPVDDHRCLNVFTSIPGVYAATQCAQVGGNVIGTGDIVELKACLEYLMVNSSVKVVKTGGRNYDVQTGSQVSKISDYMVACLVGRSQVTTTAINDVESTSQSTTSNQKGGISQTFNTMSSPRCLPQVGSGCPKGFYPVDDNNCLNVFPPPIASDYSSTRCDYFDVRLINDEAIKPCLEDLLFNTTVKVLRVNGRYYNVPNGWEVARTSNYMIPCLVDKRRLAQPTITDFYMQFWLNFPKWKTTFLNVSAYDVLYDVSNGWLRVTCKANGYPAPEVTLSRDNVPLPNSTGGVLTIAKPSCLDSGLYACHARNVVNSTQIQRKIQFRSPVKIEPVEIINNRTGNTKTLAGDHVTVRCSVTGCPSPDVLTLTNDANLTLYALGKSSVVHEISSVQCSDMGAYLCRVEADGQETRADLRVAGCPIQLCRGQNKSVTIPRNLNQTTSFSVCLISQEMPTWEKTTGIKNISVTIAQRNGSSVYFTAEISVSKIGENDSDTSTIVMKNSNGRLEYHIQLQSDRRPIKVDPVLFTNNRTGISKARQGDHVTVKCSVTGRPSPKQLTLASDANLTLGVFGKSSVVHEISSVQCSDMGAYLCRAEVEQLEEKGELLLEGCPIQFCRGQKKSATISRNLKQTTSFSVCLVSVEMPTWENTFEIQNISVTFTQRPGSRIYFSAEIGFSKNDGDGASIIVMKNRHGNLFYSVTLEPDDRLEGENRQQPPGNEQTSLIPIVLPLVMIVFIVLAVIGLVVYRRKTRRYKEAITEMSARLETSNTNENTSNEHDEARYETIDGKEVDNSTYLVPISSSEYEAVAVEYCVILEH